jgi:transcriptional regulator with XRE-family HTH domain
MSPLFFVANLATVGLALQAHIRRESVAMTALTELLLAHVPEGVSRRELARRAGRQNNPLSLPTITAYLRGDHGRPDEATLRGFHELLHIPMQELRQAAGMPAGGGPYVPPEEAARLDERERRALDELIRAIVARKERDASEEQATLTTDEVAEGLDYIGRLRASGKSALADRVAESLAINSASDTANNSSSD